MPYDVILESISIPPSAPPLILLQPPPCFHYLLLLFFPHTFLFHLLLLFILFYSLFFLLLWFHPPPNTHTHFSMPSFLPFHHSPPHPSIFPVLFHHSPPLPIILPILLHPSHSSSSFVLLLAGGGVTCPQFGFIGKWSLGDAGV